jgi:hypothetical protein
MAACYNTIVEFEDRFMDSWLKFDFSVLEIMFRNSDRVGMGHYYFRSDFCEHDDEETFLYTLAILIGHFKKAGLVIKLCYLDGLEDILKEDYHWFSLTNEEREFAKAQFRDIRIVTPNDTDHETILSGLRMGYDYRPNNA